VPSLRGEGVVGEKKPSRRGGVRSFKGPDLVEDSSDDGNDSSSAAGGPTLRVAEHRVSPNH
jgi:hypothetical protein